MGMTVRLVQPSQAPHDDGPSVEPLPIWGSDLPPVIVGAQQDAQGLPVPVTPTPCTLFGPRGCYVAAGNGPLWVTDTGHHRLLGWRECPVVDGAPADWVIGQPDFFSEGRNAKTDLGPETLNVPTGIASYGQGLVVADAWNHRVLVWRQLPADSHCPPDVVLGQETFQAGEINRGQAEPSANTLYWPYGVSAWGETLIVADTGNRRVLIWFTPPVRNGQPADLVLGQPVFDRRDENAGGQPTPMSMRWPHAIARWREAFAVADAGNNRIMVWDRMPTESGAECQWILGQADAACVDHNGGHYWPHAGSLNMPYGAAVSDDWLLVADTANSRLLGWHHADLANGAPARALAAQATFELKGDNQWRFSSPDTLCWPYGLSVSDGRLAIADSGNNRVIVRAMHPAMRREARL